MVTVNEWYKRYWSLVYCSTNSNFSRNNKIWSLRKDKPEKCIYWKTRHFATCTNFNRTAWTTNTAEQLAKNYTNAAFATSTCICWQLRISTVMKTKILYRGHYRTDIWLWWAQSWQEVRSLLPCSQRRRGSHIPVLRQGSSPSPRSRRGQCVPGISTTCWSLSVVSRARSAQCEIRRRLWAPSTAAWWPSASSPRPPADLVAPTACLRIHREQNNYLAKLNINQNVS